MTSKNRQRINRLLDYSSAFGVLKGTALLTRVLRHRGTFGVNVPTLSHPVYVRSGTADTASFDAVFVRRQYEPPFEITRPLFIVDAGANVGYASVFFASRYPAARIIAIEPDEENYELLSQNVAPYPRVTPIRAALWPRAASVKIVNPDAAVSSFRVEEETGGGAEVAAVTLPDLLSEWRAERIDILKMDIEGSEKEVFASDTEAWLGRTVLIMAELHDEVRPGCSHSFFSAIDELEYTMKRRGEIIAVLNETAAQEKPT